ncbi:hypothetical protein SAMN06265347_101131 [Halobellus salinus]|nr:hypothetical protein SAMN06265347_101131 [Halobellus salinus]
MLVSFLKNTGPGAVYGFVYSFFAGLLRGSIRNGRSLLHPNVRSSPGVGHFYNI